MNTVEKRILSARKMLADLMGVDATNTRSKEHPMYVFFTHVRNHSVHDYAVQIGTMVMGTIPLCSGLVLAWTHVEGGTRFQINGSKQSMFKEFITQATEMFGSLNNRGGVVL